jgi:hypothetical protein
MKTAILAMLIAASGAGATSPKAEASFDGRYCGRLWSSGALVQAITELKTGSDGRLTGSYQFSDFGGMTSGTLTEGAPGTGLDRTLDWQDKYGTGKLFITVKPDYSGFTGKWQDTTGTPNELWDGIRC